MTTSLSHTPKKAAVELWGTGPNAVGAIVRGTGWLSLSQSPEQTGNLAEEAQAVLEGGQDFA